MGNIPLFLFAARLLQHWVAFVMGSSVMAIIAIVERAIRKLPTSVYVLAILLVGTICASYGAWQDEYATLQNEDGARTKAENKAETLQGKLDALTLPKFEVTIRRIARCNCLKNSDDLMVAILTDISNEGAPSYINDAELEVKLADGRSFPHVRPTYPMLKIKGKEVPEPNLLALYNQNPIATYSKPRGYIFFTLRGVSQDAVYLKGDVFTLHIWDSTGKDSTSTWTMTGSVETNPAYFPGQ